MALGGGDVYTRMGGVGIDPATANNPFFWNEGNGIFPLYTPRLLPDFTARTSPSTPSGFNAYYDPNGTPVYVDDTHNFCAADADSFTTYYDFQQIPELVLMLLMRTDAITQSTGGIALYNIPHHAKVYRMMYAICDAGAIGNFNLWLTTQNSPVRGVHLDMSFTKWKTLFMFKENLRYADFTLIDNFT